MVSYCGKRKCIISTTLNSSFLRYTLCACTTILVLFNFQVFFDMSIEDNCIFCRIIRGEIPAAKIFEDERVFAFLDIEPFNFGHALVIPKVHCQSFTIVPDEYLSAMIAAAKRIAPAVMHVTGAPAFNLLLNNGSIAGQEVPHTHLHIIPRFVDDAVLLSAPQKQYTEGDITQLADAISKRIDEIAMK